MNSLQKLKDQMLNDVIIYIDGCTHLSENDIFILKTDISQIIVDLIEDAEEQE